MYPDDTDQPFDSIESAQDFMNILAETVVDTMKDLRAEHKTAIEDGQARRAEALELALFKLKTLNCHVHKSRRIFNDLRMIRRLLHSDRQAGVQAAAT